LADNVGVKPGNKADRFGQVRSRRLRQDEDSDLIRKLASWIARQNRESWMSRWIIPFFNSFKR
jgi:hypothetical protein